MKTQFNAMKRNFDAIRPYLFFRDEGFYVLELGSDDEAIANAECNPGTLRVFDAMTDLVVWIAPTAPPAKPENKEGVK